MRPARLPRPGTSLALEALRRFEGETGGYSGSQLVGGLLFLAADADQAAEGGFELEQVQAAAARVEVLADGDDVVVG